MSSIDLDKRKDGPTVEHDEDAIPGLHYQTVDPHVDTDAISYGPSGVKGLFCSKYVFGAATLASLGGFSMGYDMGVISIINVMEPFHQAFPKAETSFGKGLMTGMLLLGAFIGCIFMSYLSDRISRKWAITAMVVAFDIGAILQTAAVNYDMLVAGRFIGGIGVGTLAMVSRTLTTRPCSPTLRKDQKGRPNTNPNSLLTGRTPLHLRNLTPKYARHTTSPRIHLHLLRCSNSLLDHLRNTPHDW